MPEIAYVWSLEGAEVRVELEREAAVQLRQAVNAAGPEEIGGFLLGTMQDGLTHITGFQLVAIEHRRGEAYDLTPLDRLRFSRRCAPWLNKRPHEIRAVGFFRTHVRPGLFLDEHDFRTVREFFADPRQVVLLVRPEPNDSPVAGFFFWEGGDMERRQSFRPFPLDDAIDGATERPVPAAVAAAVVEAPLVSAPAEPLPEPAPEPMKRPPARVPEMPPPAARRVETPEPREHSNTRKYALIAACIPLVAGLAYFAGRHEASPATPANTPASTGVATGAGTGAVNGQAPPEVLASKQSTPPGQETSQPQASQVPASQPPPTAPAAAETAASEPGNLSRGPVVAHFPLARKQSPMPEREARARYGRPSTPLYPATGPEHQPSRVIYTRQQSGVSVNPPAPDNAQQASSGQETVRQQANAEAARSEGPAQQDAGGTQEVARLEPRNVPEAGPSLVSERPRFRPELHPAITVEWVEPGSGLGSRLVRLPKKILTLGMSGDNFTPPRPLHEIAPTVPPYLARELTAAVPVTVRISVDAGGRVRATELISRSADPQLASLALNAARKWEFIAARQNNTPVASSVVARFRFRPPQQ